MEQNGRHVAPARTAPQSAASTTSNNRQKVEGEGIFNLQNALKYQIGKAFSGLQKLANDSPEMQSIRASRQVLTTNNTRHSYFSHEDPEMLRQNRRDNPTDCASNEGGIPWRDLYSVDWTPKELCVKFRQQMEGYQLGANFEFDGIQEHGCNTKIVFKPVGPEPKWKVVFEPKQGDLRLTTRKIPIGPLLSFQVGLGHDFHSRRTGWKWRVTSSLGDMWPAQIKQKTTLPICPGFNARIAWNAEYVLPDVHGSLGTGEPAVGLDLGHLRASLDRVEAVFTHAT